MDDVLYFYGQLKENQSKLLMFKAVTLHNNIVCLLSCQKMATECSSVNVTCFRESHLSYEWALKKIYRLLLQWNLTSASSMASWLLQLKINQNYIKLGFAIFTVMLFYSANSILLVPNSGALCWQPYSWGCDNLPCVFSMFRIVCIKPHSLLWKI